MTHHLTSMASRVLALALFGLHGCAEPSSHARADAGASDGDSDESGSTDVSINRDSVIAMAMSYDTLLVPMTDGHELSQTHSDAASVLVWGSADNAALFQTIDPSDPTQDISFPEGTLFVKEHFNEVNETIGLTIMYKGPKGYHDAGRDWYWARIRGTEVTHEGRDETEFCISCHEAAYNTDFVVGFEKSQ